MSKPRPPRPITPELLEKAALSYLERFSASAASVRRVLTRRIRRAEAVTPLSPDEAAQMVEAVVAKLTGAGYLDDRRYAQVKAGSLLRQGRPPAVIARRLSAQGVDGEIIADAVATLVEECAEDGVDAELSAARALAKRRRLGPHREAERRAVMRDKDLASLGRAGFSWRIAKAVIDGGED